MKKSIYNIFLYIKKKHLWIVLTILLLILFFPLIRCETLTIVYGKQFEGLELKTNMLIKSDYYKVINYENEEAQVYYVLKNVYGNTINFHKINDSWEIDNWNTVWSSTGSASSVVWPYWWHFIYGGL